MVKQGRWKLILLFGFVMSMLPAMLGDGLGIQQGPQMDASSLEAEVLDEELVMAAPNDNNCLLQAENLRDGTPGIRISPSRR